MADRYWVATSAGNWSDTANWSTTDGGSGGSSVPTANDDVFFTSTANGNCTLTASTNARVLNFVGGAGYTGTFDINTRMFVVNNHITFNSGMTLTGTTGRIRFGSGNQNLTTNGLTVPVFFDFVGNGIVTLQDDLTCKYITSNITARAINPNGKNVIFINLDSNFGSLYTRTGNFNNFTINGGSNISQLALGNNITVEGTLTINGDSLTNKFHLMSHDFVKKIITSNENDFNNIIIQNIEGAGTASWDFSSQNDVGDGGGNEEIIFPTGINCFYVGGAANGNWSDTSKWMTTSGGSTSARVPLPQDTAIIDSNSFSGNRTLTQDATYLSSVNFTGSSEVTWDTRTGCRLFGNLNTTNLNTFLTNTTHNNYDFYNVNDVTITSAGIAMNKYFYLRATGKVTLLDDFECFLFSLMRGTFDANNYNCNFSVWHQSGSFERTLFMGNGTWEIRGDSWTVWLSNSTNLNFNAQESTLKFTGDYSGGRNFNGDGFTFYNIENAQSSGAGFLILRGFTCNNLKINAGLTTKFYRGDTFTINGNFEAIGTEANPIIITSDTTTAFNLVFDGTGVVDSVDWCEISYSNASPADTWYAGNNSTDDGNNTGWLFEAAPSGITVGVKIAGMFVDKPLMIKKSGTFEQVTNMKIGGWS